MSQPSAPTTYYAVLREREPHWDTGRPMRHQQHWQEHAAFMDRLADEGVVVVGGPVGEGEQTFLRILAADSPHAIVERLTPDPWT